MAKYRILLNVVLVVVLLLLVTAPGVASAAAPATATATTVSGAPPCCWHHVVRGDTLTRIAYRYHTTVWQLARMNNIWNLNKIYAGRWLKVPCAPRCTWHCW